MSARIEVVEMNPRIPPELNAKSLSAALGATLGMLIGPTAIIAPPIGLFLPVVSQEFGLGRAGFPLLMLVASVFAGLFSPIAGRIIDRFGIRATILPAVILFGLAQAALALTAARFPAFVCVMILVGILVGIQNPTAYTKLLALWFERSRGRMVALVCAIGSGGGGVLVPQLVHRLIQEGGWRLGYAGLGAFVLLGTPVLFLLLREPRRQDRTESRGAADRAVTGVSRREAIRKPAFWMIATAFMGASCSLVALSVHVPAWIADSGGTTDIAAGFLSVFAMGSVIAQSSSGFLLDRINSPKVGAIFLGVAFVGALILTQESTDSTHVLIAAFTLGMGLGGELGMACYFLSRYFGLRSYGEIYGLLYGSLVVASGLGPVLMGVGFEHFGNYTLVFRITAGTLLLSTVLILLLPPYVFAVRKN